jgi:hypothetical protein
MKPIFMILGLYTAAVLLGMGCSLAVEKGFELYAIHKAKKAAL